MSQNARNPLVGSGSGPNNSGTVGTTIGGAGPDITNQSSSSIIVGQASQRQQIDQLMR